MGVVSMRREFTRHEEVLDLADDIRANGVPESVEKRGCIWSWSFVCMDSRILLGIRNLKKSLIPIIRHHRISDMMLESPVAWAGLLKVLRNDPSYGCFFVLSHSFYDRKTVASAATAHSRDGMEESGLLISTM